MPRVCPLLSIANSTNTDCIRKQCQLWQGSPARLDRHKMQTVYNCVFAIGAAKNDKGMVPTKEISLEKLAGMM